MRAIDTDVLVRLLARDDERQVSVAEKFISKGAWVSHLVVIETAWVLESVYDRSREEIASAVQMLLNHEHLSIQEPEVIESALQQLAKHKGISFPDVLMLEVARKQGQLPFGTFDRNLAKLDGCHRL